MGSGVASKEGVVIAWELDVRWNAEDETKRLESFNECEDEGVQIRDASEEHDDDSYIGTVYRVLPLDGDPRWRTAANPQPVDFDVVFKHTERVPEMLVRWDSVEHQQ